MLLYTLPLSLYHLRIFPDFHVSHIWSISDGKMSEKRLKCKIDSSFITLISWPSNEILICQLSRNQSIFDRNLKHAYFLLLSTSFSLSFQILFLEVDQRERACIRVLSSIPSLSFNSLHHFWMSHFFRSLLYNYLRSDIEVI